MSNIIKTAALIDNKQNMAAEFDINIITSVKQLTEMPNVMKAVVPCYYAHPNSPIHSPAFGTSDADLDSIPIVDLSLLSSEDPDQHSKAIHDLGRACEDWGFFMVRIRIINKRP